MEMSFDDWMKLYQENPELYEQRRKEAIEKIITSAPVEHQHRLRQTQWKLDAIRQTHTPLGATVEMSKLMWESFDTLKYHLNDLTQQLEQPQPERKRHLTLVK